MNIRRIGAIAWKEFFHIWHDPRSLVIIFVLPVVQLIMFGYALNMEIQNVPLAVIDFEHSVVSRRVVQAFEGSRFFTVFYAPSHIKNPETLFLNREARAILIIPEDFSQKLVQKREAPVQLLIDASDPNAAVNIYHYCRDVITLANQQLGHSISLPFRVEPSIWFNPDLKSAYFFVPGLLAFLLIMISALLTSVAIAREKETGTMEQILVSPVRAGEIIAGKVLPYVVLASLDASLILLIGVFVFRVPFVGSIVLFTLLTVLYIITGLSLGLMISTFTRTQQVAMMIAQVITLLPTLFLSGFIFPIRSMPKILQYISYVIPARYFLIIVRGIMLKGNVLLELTTPVLFLLVLSLLLLTVARRRFQTTLG